MMLAQHRQQGGLNLAALRMGEAHTVGHEVGVDPCLAALQNLHTAHSLKHGGGGPKPDKVAHTGDCMQPGPARQAPSAGGFAGSARMRYAVVSCRWEERWLTLLLLCCKENLSMATTLEAM